jgi:hypothetical protein
MRETTPERLARRKREAITRIRATANARDQLAAIEEALDAEELDKTTAASLRSELLDQRASTASTDPSLPPTSESSAEPIGTDSLDIDDSKNKWRPPRRRYPQDLRTPAEKEIFQAFDLLVGKLAALWTDWKIDRSPATLNELRERLKSGEFQALQSRIVGRGDVTLPASGSVEVLPEYGRFTSCRTKHLDRLRDIAVPEDRYHEIHSSSGSADHGKLDEQGVMLATLELADQIESLVREAREPMRVATPPAPQRPALHTRVPLSRGSKLKLMSACALAALLALAIIELRPPTAQQASAPTVVITDPPPGERGQVATVLQAFELPTATGTLIIASGSRGLVTNEQCADGTDKLRVHARSTHQNTFLCVNRALLAVGAKP